MRVTDQQMYQSISRQVAQRWEQLAKIQEQVASGKRINKPSDDPNAADRVGAMEATLCKLTDCQRASTAAKNLVEITESTLGEASGLLMRAKELAVQAANENYDAGDRSQMALEVRALFDQLQTLGNTEVGGRYIFAGFINDTPPFQADGSYVGDGGIPELEVSRVMKFLQEPLICFPAWTLWRRLWRLTIQPQSKQA